MSLRLSIPASDEDEGGALLPAVPDSIPRDAVSPPAADGERDMRADNLWLDFYERILGR